jgi:hypothetical protein
MLFDSCNRYIINLKDVMIDPERAMVDPGKSRRQQSLHRSSMHREFTVGRANSGSYSLTQADALS